MNSNSPKSNGEPLKDFFRDISFLMVLVQYVFKKRKDIPEPLDHLPKTFLTYPSGKKLTNVQSTVNTKWRSYKVSYAIQSKLYLLTHLILTTGLLGMLLLSFPFYKEEMEAQKDSLTCSGS